MTARDKSWLDRLTPMNWITLATIFIGFVVNFTVSGYQISENAEKVRSNKVEIDKTKDEVQDLRADNKVIIEMLKDLSTKQREDTKELKEAIKRLDDRIYQGKK